MGSGGLGPGDGDVVGASSGNTERRGNSGSRIACRGTAGQLVVDRRGDRLIADAGFGEYFIHRTGHGIGLEEHEDPYIIAGNTEPLAPGHAFSIEPGIYIGGRWGIRLEDIVVASEAGPQRLNNADHSLVSV